jgi:hypothetical protein
MKKKIVLFALVLISLAALASCASAPPKDGQYAKLAQCLTSKGVKFYGAFWCPHCAEQKAIFGDDLRYITYVECDPRDPTSKPDECAAKGVKAYPTWFFPGQGTETGVHQPADLAKKVGCESTLGLPPGTEQTSGTTVPDLTQATGIIPVQPAGTQLTTQQ